MKYFILLFSFFICVACNSQHHGQTKTHDTEHGHDHQKKTSHKHGSANAQMHKSSVKDLITNFESPERDSYQHPQKVLDYLGNIQGQTIIDIGAGSGYFSVKLAAQGAEVIAADVDDEFLDHINNRIQDENLQHIETRKIPYDSPDLKDEEVDMVFMVNTYHHIENRVDYFNRVKQGTKVDGSLVIIDFYKTDLPVGPSVDHKISMDIIVNELKLAGYTIFDVNVDLLPYQYIIKAK